MCGMTMARGADTSTRQSVRHLADDRWGKPPYDLFVPRPRTVVLIAGASGCGKSRLAKHCGLPILRLDNFYHDDTAPNLPRGADGLIDWDDIRAWDVDSATDALVTLSRTGQVSAPLYDIAANAATDTVEIDAVDAQAFVAEGIFATAMLARCVENGIPVLPIWLDRGRWLTWWLRLSRDIREHRKPVRVLLRRGALLRRAEPGLRQAGVAAGFPVMSMRQAKAFIQKALPATDSDNQNRQAS